jgi:hypothetical protein
MSLLSIKSKIGIHPIGKWFQLERSSFQVSTEQAMVIQKQVFLLSE